jgi:hypothetical protein
MAINSIKITTSNFINTNSRSIPPGPRPVNNKIIQESGAMPVYMLLENSFEFIIQE